MADLRTVVAQATSKAATAHGERLYHLRFEIADAVLDALIPAIADVLAEGGPCDCRCAEGNRDREPEDHMHNAGCASWPNPSAARAVRLLGIRG